MTCIAGVKHGETVYIGADSAGVAGYSISIRADQKVFVRGAMLFGAAGSFRMMQLLRYRLEIPAHAKGVSDHEYMVTDFIDAVRKCLKAGGARGEKDAVEHQDGCFLVGYRGRIYQIEGDFQVGYREEDFDSIGCGQDVALGSLHSSKGKHPKDRIKAALTAAARFSAGVRPPFRILKIGEGKK